MKRTLVIALGLAAALPAAAQQTIFIPDSQRDRAAIEEAQREAARRTAQDQQARVLRARENCIASRGVDCDTPQGLAEWVQLERSRAEAVLDRAMPGGSASVGSSQPR